MDFYDDPGHEVCNHQKLAVDCRTCQHKQLAASLIAGSR